MKTRNRPPQTDADPVSADELQQDLDKLGPRRGGGWVRQPVDVWASVWPQLARPWLEEQILFDLRWQQDQYGRVLSRDKLARRYGWTRDQVRTPLRHTNDWWDPKWGDAPTAREPRAPKLTRLDPPVPELTRVGPNGTGEPEQPATPDPSWPELAQPDPTVPQRGESQPPPPPPAESEERGDSAPPAPPPLPPGRQPDMFGPRRAVKRSEPRSKPIKPPTMTALAGRIANAWKAAHADQFGVTYPLTWAGPGVRPAPGDDGPALRSLVSAFELDEDHDRGLLRFKAAAAVYFEAVARGIAYPHGDPASLHFFLKDLAKWAGYGDQRLKPRVAGTPPPEVEAASAEPVETVAELIEAALKEWKEGGSK